MLLVGFVIRRVYLFLPSILGTELLGYLPRIIEYLFSVTRCLRFGEKKKLYNLSSFDSSRGIDFRRFREIAKSDLSLLCLSVCLSVCPSARMEQLAATGLIFMKFEI